MLRLKTRVCELSPAVLECISWRHSGLAWFRRCQSASAVSAASPTATDSECKPIQKLLVANRGKGRAPSCPEIPEISQLS